MTPNFAFSVVLSFAMTVLVTVLVIATITRIRPLRRFAGLPDPAGALTVDRDNRIIAFGSAPVAA